MAWWIVKAILGPILRMVWRPWAEGVGNVPRRGPAILASNHLSFADHFFGPLPLRRRVVFLGKAEYFTGRGLKGLLAKAFFKGVGVIPLDRTGGKASEAALHTGLRVLDEGKLLGIYPEGTRAPDNRLYRGKTGVARLALEARVKVVPMAMINTYELMPTGERPRLGIRPGVRFGEPLDFSKYYGMEEDRAVLRTITDEIMRELCRLSGQEYVDRYAADVKAELQGTAQPGEDPFDALHDPADGERADGERAAPARVDAADPADAGDPAEPADPADPVETGDPIDAADPTDPTDAADPADADDPGRGDTSVRAHDGAREG